MRIGLLSPLALALLAGIPLAAQASSDDSCYPDWRVSRDSLEPCSNQPFLSPGNDSRVNLRLLLADKKAAPLTPNALGEDDLAQGFGPVPFPVYRLVPIPAASDEPDNQADDSRTAELDTLLQPLGVKREEYKTAGEAFLNGEGSRCRSNDDDSATAFISQVIKADMPPAERDVLVKARLQLLTTCDWDGQVVDAQLTPSANAQRFRTYLQAAADFYSGRFGDAERGFAAAASSDAPWLKETALYMTARTSLNQAQAQAFDEYGMPQREHVDKPALNDAEQGFLAYLKTYPQGDYVASARGLLRRVHWLANDDARLAEDFTWQLTEATDAQRNVSVDELVEEADLKLLMAGNTSTNSPMLQVVSDLMAMRAHTPPLLSRADLDKQKSTFVNEPALFDYLQAAYALYVEHQPDTALKHLPADVPSTLDYFAFSQQTLRALALEAKQDWAGAQALWLQLLPLATQPLQRDQLELALAMNYERSGQLAKVFAADSPISAKQVRYILLRNVAGPDLLRQQIANASDPTERQSAQFVLLYKDLLHNQFATFADDLKQASLSEDKLGTSLGYTYTSGQTLKLFQWNGDKAESGYACPGIAQTAATLQQDAKNPHALNCFGEFILRNGLDGMPLEHPRAAGSLGSTASDFKGETFSRLDGYKQVIANAKAPKTDKAYALFRAINCYAPAGYNSCGGEDVAPAVRKGWFRQLKSGYADTQWGKSLQYYW
ncbi:outer membrane assembly lipoprotein YfiO [Pseudomonas fluorescens]|uniref:Outer membrane assembly lipoprotein YfiO n=1 Tax=Pseudomonas fluorescens TaxID=294 RepID=A0A2N1E062_PSEFL|nr:outer membrane assembly lipoprotein YfiO [Pseudomonas fluorescens]MBD8098047.1 outer membrane assembly lipoprotein YfiO [Pseudomonas fluorescens]MBD8775934.1 outer membrane assembly lipoprotein YfiO [Pseudomonas fluorescens]MBD8782234.1 outer membrane assembly lipoprotein YfiO [Pseudomonas fluorescens]MBD8795597.1 outer membrane assembly lipoprotein YfiO [Pseudomonas fluorescens]PKH17769.1 outer membrane assembly lipoprotein YfiO [Pseudomonas fluorescens]